VVPACVVSISRLAASRVLVRRPVKRRLPLRSSG
jgi:hypothetical protein